MLSFFSAEYDTAVGIIRHYHLKKRMTEHHFQIFTGATRQGTEIELIVTGTGAVRAAMAAGYVMMGHEVSEQDVFVCITPAEDRNQECILYAELYDSAKNRYYYPDMCPSHNLEEGSSDSVELAAWYEALSCFAKQHQLVFAGVGADNLNKLCSFLESFEDLYKGRHPFHHVYVERKLAEDGSTKALLERLSGSRIVWINHYKDIFNRKNQDVLIQKAAPALILAKKEGQLIYAGSPECQNFGNEYFYYTSSMMNCLFDCEYCYLQGMYPSAYVVLFTNLEDIFEQTDMLLKEHPVYLCISYDTDMVALEGLTGYCKRWIDYASTKENILVELRTKAAVSQELCEYARKKECEKIIFAFTLTPEMVQSCYEHNTPSVSTRIDSIRLAVQEGLKVRVCFDPIILPYSGKEGGAEEQQEECRAAYDRLIDMLFEQINPGKLWDVSLGEFRVPCDYLKRMRKKRADSALLMYPFTTEGGSFCYGESGAAIADYVENRLKERIAPEKIYRWR